MAKQILAAKLTALKNGNCKIDGKAIDPIRDVQIIVALNEIGDLSRKAVNEVARGVLNPDGEQAEGNPFRVGDKAIATENAKLKCCDQYGNISSRGDDMDSLGSDGDDEGDDSEEWFTANGEKPGDKLDLKALAEALKARGLKPAAAGLRQP